MTTRIFVFTLLIFTLLFCIRCKKSAPPLILPPITQTGVGSFGCKINGQVWIPYVPCNSCSKCVEFAYNIQPAYTVSKLPLRFVMQAGRHDDPYTGNFIISPAFLRSLTDGSFIYGIGNIADSLDIEFDNNSNRFSLKLRDPSNIFMITKLDAANNIVSGTFSFTLYGSFNDTLLVTDGRFDVKIGADSRCSK